jgi:hypothetical protein
VSDQYQIVITFKEVSEGDVTDLAQQIWDDNTEAFDGARGEFDVRVSRDGFPVDWDPRMEG